MCMHIINYIYLYPSISRSIDGPGPLFDYGFEPDRSVGLSTGIGSGFCQYDENASFLKYP